MHLSGSSISRSCAVLFALITSTADAAFSENRPSARTEESAFVTQRRRDFLDENLRFVAATVVGVSGIVVVGPPMVKPPMAEAANIPKSTGADLSRTGTVETLIPIVRIRNAMEDARGALLGSSAKSSSSDALSDVTVAAVSKALDSIPSDENAFKRLFDEYSDPVSYKQKFMDQNAFLVYYTGGFDGPNRPKMESSGEEVPRQTLQYGARNDSWSSFDDVLAELEFARTKDGSSSSVGDILGPLDRSIAAVDSYLSLASQSDVDEAARKCR